jgi:exopolysaccharide biosynthesis polyprenyl glycosylphosphotransferase
MRINSRKLTAYIIVLSDIVLLNIALIITLFLRYRTLNPENLKEHFVAFFPLFVLFLIVFYANRLYELSAPQKISAVLAQFLPSILINFFISVAYFYILQGRNPETITPRTNLIIFFVIFSIMFILFRRFIHKILKKTFTIKAAIIGKNLDTEKLIKYLSDHPEFNYQVVFNAEEDVLDINLIRRLVMESNVSTIIVLPHISKKLIPHLSELAQMNIDFFDLPTFIETRLEKIPLSFIEESYIIEKIVWHEPKFSIALKNLLDKMVSLLIILITLPIWIIVPIIIKISSRGPIFYIQKRIGYRGRPFYLIKFRTMIEDAEKFGPQWAQENDPRVTPVGKILRKTHLDELPQLINILKGEMSFVGPRPERPEFVEELRQKIPFYDLRHLVKPGLTGWAQLNFRYGASIEDAREKLEYDLYYIKNRSLILDLAIILKTLSIILRGGTGR